ncbi:TPA: restriction endonuclease subunit S, partial [Haemophilus influenzae]
MSDIEWIETTVGEYCPFIYGKALPQSKRISGNIPVYGSNGIVDFHNSSCVNTAGVIIGRKGSVGAIHLSEKPFWAIDTAFYIVNDDLEELKFTYYLLKTLGLSEMNSDSAVPGLNRENAHSLKIKIPKDKFHRCEIGKRLSIFDQKIQLNTQINQTLEQIAQALFRSWFVDFEPVRTKVQALSEGMSLEQAELAAMQTISGKTPEELTALSQTQPEHYAELAETTKAFPCEMVEIDGVEVPKGWELSTIGDCYDVVMGQSPKGETYNENKQGMLFYQGRAEFGWRFPTPRLFTTDPKRIAEQNSILMSIRAPVGDINIALEKCCIGRGLAALQHKSKSLSFGLYQIQSIKPELDLFNGEGTVFGSINQ